jgi:hypothetical protein
VIAVSACTKPRGAAKQSQNQRPPLIQLSLHNFVTYYSFLDLSSMNVSFHLIYDLMFPPSNPVLVRDTKAEKSEHFPTNYFAMHNGYPTQRGRRNDLQAVINDC